MGTLVFAIIFLSFLVIATTVVTAVGMLSAQCTRREEGRHGPQPD